VEHGPVAGRHLAAAGAGRQTLTLTLLYVI
jgi:hypothetical protein